MFNKFHKLIAYTLVISMLAGANAAPVVAASADDEQSAHAEVLQEESRDSSDSGGGPDDIGLDDSDSGGGSDDSTDSGRQDESQDDSDDGGKSDDPDDGGHSESSVDDDSHLNDEEDRWDISGDSSDAGNTGGNAGADEEHEGSSSWYDDEGNWHTEEGSDNSSAGSADDHADAGSTGGEYAGENEPGQGEGGRDANGQGQGGSGQGQGQGQDGAGTHPQDHPADPAASQDPAEHPIEKKAQTVTGKPSYAKHMGDDYFRLDVASDGDGPLVFWSSDESVIDMSHTGRAYIKGTGTAVIGIQAEETEHCKKSNILRVTITVRKREQNVNVPVYYTKSVETDPFKIELTKDGNGPVIYESSNRNVATVSKTGKVTIKSVGSAKITVYAAETATCMESAAKTIHVNVGPRKTELSSSINVENNKATVEWQQQNNVSGYLIQYSTKRDFSNGKVVRAAPTSKSAEIRGLTDDAYYVRIRSYKTQGGKNLYSEWSAAEAFGGKIATPAAGGIPGRNSLGSRAGSVTETAAEAAPGTAAIVRNSGRAGISPGTSRIGTGGGIGAAGTSDGENGVRIGATGTDEIIGAAGTDEGIGEGQGSSPMFSTIVTNPYWIVGNALSMRVTNRGSSVMRVYSEGAWLSNGIGGLFDRDLYIAAADDSGLPYVDIRPGEVMELRFRSTDNRMLRYSRRTELCYAFSYDGVKYTAVSGEDNSTEYAEVDPGVGLGGLILPARE